jgi:hypothetical protein
MKEAPPLGRLVASGAPDAQERTLIRPLSDASAEQREHETPVVEVGGRAGSPSSAACELLAAA